MADDHSDAPGSAEAPPSPSKPPASPPNPTAAHAAQSRSSSNPTAAHAAATAHSSSSEPAARIAPTSPRPHHPHRLRWLFIVIAAIVFFVLIMMWRGHDEKKAAADAARQRAAAPIAISVATATRGNVGVYLEAIGTVTPVHTAAITAQVNGAIVAVHYREGQVVRKGDPLIDIDSRPYEATLMQAEGILDRDRNLLAQAQMDLERYRAALRRNAIAEQQEADQAKVVLQDQGVVKNDEGTVRYDQLQVAYCHITSPFNGVVGLRLVDPGNLVQANGTTTLAVVAELQPITVIFTIPEDGIAAVRARLRAGAVLPVDAFDRAAQVRLAGGALLALDNQIDTTTGTVKARAQFANADGALFPNQFVNVRLLVDTHAGVTVVPSSTIERNGQSAYVYVIQENVAHERAVKVGTSDGAVTEVSGVNPGEVLANSSFEKLQDKSKVAVAPAGGMAPAAARGGAGSAGAGAPDGGQSQGQGQQGKGKGRGKKGAGSSSGSGGGGDSSSGGGR